MKFNFEKHAPSPQEVKPSLEKTQEQFDQEILQEADKLGTNLQKLNEEINKAGGPEKFQEFYSEKGSRSFSRSGYEEEFKAPTRGADVISHDNHYAESSKESSKGHVKLAAIIAVMGGLITAAGIHEGQSELVYHIEAGVTGIGTLLTVISSIKDRIKAKAYERKSKIMELKMKMTDTPHEIKMEENN